MKLIVVTGPMFSGKSSRLIVEGEKYIKAGFKTVYLKPIADERWDKTVIETHDGIKVPAVVLDNTFDMDIVERSEVILIDEVQFIPVHLIKGIQDLVRRGKTVIVAGLDMDYLGRSFPVTRELMAQSDEVFKIKGQCRCGKDSVMSSISKEYRKDMLNPIILGDGDKYTAMCRECFGRENYEE